MNRFIAWIMSLFCRVPAETYTPAQRAIFRYWNGAEMIGVDPLKIQSELLAIPGFNTDLRMSLTEVEWEKAQEEARQAYWRLIPHVRRIFGVAEFEEKAGKASGLTSAETFLLLADFMGFLLDLKKKANILPTLPSVSPESSPTSDSATPSTSDSSSSASESSADESRLCASESTSL